MPVIFGEFEKAFVYSAKCNACLLPRFLSAGGETWQEGSNVRFHCKTRLSLKNLASWFGYRLVYRWVVRLGPFCELPRFRRRQSAAGSRPVLWGTGGGFGSKFGILLWRLSRERNFVWQFLNLR